MQVYVELAAAENFCMDFTLLYAAKKLTKNRGKTLYLAFGAAVGAAFAVLFPLLGLKGFWAVAVKVVSGFAICLISGKFPSVKSYLKFGGAFFALSALLGGALIGIFWLCGADYVAGGGYVLSSVPVGIPLFGGLILIIGAKRLALRLSKASKKEVKCRIYAGECSVEGLGFYDSGNKVYLRGAPVSVIPAGAFEKLQAGARINGGVKIHTVAGSKVMRVFTADKLEIDDGEKVKILSGVVFGVSPHKIARIVLHPDLTEE